MNLATRSAFWCQQMTQSRTYSYNSLLHRSHQTRRQRFAHPPGGISMSKSNVAVLIFGGNAVAVSKAGVISVVGFHGKSFLDIGTGPDGAFVSGDFFGKDGSIVATLQTNRFTLNRLRYFTKRVDKSTLTVIDEDNVELLRIRFCSSVVFEMAGRIRFPDRTEMWACFEKADSKSGSFS